MTFLAILKGALGLKELKPEKPKRVYPAPLRKPIPRRSRKKLAYLASDDRKAGIAHMGRVARLPCLVCGCHGVEVHHVTRPRDDMKVAPLCPPHHRREFGPGSYHYSPKAFHAAHGGPEAILARVADMLRAEDDGILGEWF